MNQKMKNIQMNLGVPLPFKLHVCSAVQHYTSLLPPSQSPMTAQAKEATEAMQRQAFEELRFLAGMRVDSQNWAIGSGSRHLA